MNIKKISIAPLLCMLVIPAFAATTGGGDDMCALIVKMQDVFKILRTLAFVGAAFIMAKYAWEAISTGKINSKDLMEGAKTTGISMLVGFILLFAVGVVLQMFSGVSGAKLFGCEEEIFRGW